MSYYNTRTFIDSPKSGEKQVEWVSYSLSYSEDEKRKWLLKRNKWNEDLRGPDSLMETQVPELQAGFEGRSRVQRNPFMETGKTSDKL